MKFQSKYILLSFKNRLKWYSTRTYFLGAYYGNLIKNFCVAVWAFLKFEKSDLELYCNDHACRTSCMNFIPPYMKLLIFCGFFIPVWILVIGFYGKILSISRNHLNSMDKIEKSIQPKRKISMWVLILDIRHY